jgi:hypothetical protein
MTSFLLELDSKITNMRFLALIEKNSKAYWLATIACLVISFSIIQGAFNIDPHHWGLMLSNAKDLYDGKLPYQDIFIQYGILTTILQALAFGLGKNLLSIIVITSICYAIGILLVYATALNVLKNERNAFYVLILVFLFHPLSIYPWSNYIAFPFLMYGIYVLSQEGVKSYQYALSGAAFGLSILAREGLAPAVVMFLVLSFAYDFIRTRQFSQIKNLLYSLLGLLAPLTIFFLYLYTYELIGYWIKLSIELPRLYLDENFGSMKGQIFYALFKEIYQGYRHGDVRWILTSWVLIANGFILISAIFFKPKKYLHPGVVKIALASSLLLSSSLHLAETFRIATGSIVGLVGLMAILEYKEKTRPFFWFFAIWLGLTSTYGNRGNYFFPRVETILGAQLASAPLAIKGQLWSGNTIAYYQAVEERLSSAKQLNCNIQYQYNNTRDALFKVISPIEQLQIAPFAVSDKVSALRPDITPKRFIDEAKGIVFLDSVDQKKQSQAIAPNGYVLFANLFIPEQHFMPHKQALLIYVPKDCIK